MILNNRGASILAVIFWLAFFAATIYSVSKIAPPYISFYMLKTDVEGDVMKNAHHYSDATVRKLILDKGHSWSVPIGPDDVTIDRRTDSIAIQISWKELIDVNGIYTKTEYFNITREAPLQPGPYGSR